MSEELTPWRRGFAHWILNCLAQEIAVAQMYAEVLAADNLGEGADNALDLLHETILNAAYEVRSVIQVLKDPPRTPELDARMSEPR